MPPTITPTKMAAESDDVCNYELGILAGQATPLPEELMSSLLVFLRISDLLEWRIVAKSTERMFASESHVSRVARRLSVDLHHARDKLKALTLLAPSPRVNGAEPVANRDLHSSKWRKCLNIGHKGAHGHVVGNTIPSFLKAIEMGIDVIEFDVLTTADGVVVVHHDPLIEETGEWIENLTLSQTRQRLAHDLCTLEEMLQERTLMESGVDLYVDMKHTDIVRPVMLAVIQAVTRWGWSSDRLIVGTFRQLDLLQVNAFRFAMPELARLRTACIVDGGPLTLAREFKELKVDVLSTGKDHVTPDLVADCQRRGMQIWVWTVNSIHFMERLMKMGVDGICTDFPEMVHDANRKFRPQACGDDEKSFPYPDKSCSDPAALADSSNLGVIYPRPFPVSTGERVTPRQARKTLGGWYERSDRCHEDEPPHQQRLLHALYGDLGNVRDFAVDVIHESKLLLNVCRKSEAVGRFLDIDRGCGKSTRRDLLVGTTALHAEASIEAEQVLRPVVSSAETFQWAVDLLSTQKGLEFMESLQRSIEVVKLRPMLHFEKAFVNDLLGMASGS